MDRATTVLKEASATDLVQAVREVAAGRRYLSPPLSEHDIEAYAQKAREAPDGAVSHLSLDQAFPDSAAA
jgi:DNA-binding NarL/FixJ family response regulator